MRHSLIALALSLTTACAVEMELDVVSDTETFSYDADAKGGFPGGGGPGGDGGGFPGGGDGGFPGGDGGGFPGGGDGGFPGPGGSGGGFPGGGGSDYVECGGENTGSDYSDLTSMGGPDLLLGMEMVAATDMTVMRIEVFTGEETGTNTFGVWTHDGGAGEPDAEIANGSWSMDSTNSWQGADLDNPVSLTAGDTYWIVWEPVNTSQASLQDTGTSVNYRGSFDAGASWNGPYSNPWKYILYCRE